MPAARPKMITQDGDPVVHFDADEAEAQEHEANQTPFVFRLAGEVFTMDSPEDADWKATADVDSPGGMRSFMEELLGDDYERFAKQPCSNKRLNAIITACNKHYGMSSGESKASANSSRRTRRR